MFVLQPIHLPCLRGQLPQRLRGTGQAQLGELFLNFLQRLGKFLPGSLRPGGFQHGGGEPGKEHLAGPVQIGNPLRPQHTLHAQHSPLRPLGVSGDIGGAPNIVDIDGGIGVVKVVVLHLGADDAAAVFQELAGFLFIAQPLLDDEVLGQQSPGQAVVVDDCLLSLLGQVFPNLQHQGPLQRLLIFQPLLPDAPLAVRAPPPMLLQSLVPADVDIGGGEQIRHLVQNVLQKPYRFLLSGADQVGEDAADVQHLIVIGRLDFRLHPVFQDGSPAAELGIGGQHGAGVAGNVHLRDDLNAPFQGVGHHLANLRLGVIAAVVLRFGDISEIGVCPPGAHLGELGVFLDFHTPALIVGQVPVQGVQAAHRGGVDELENILQGHEVAADIQHKTEIGTMGFHRVPSFPQSDATIIHNPHWENKAVNKQNIQGATKNEN